MKKKMSLTLPILILSLLALQTSMVLADQTIAGPGTYTGSLTYGDRTGTFFTEDYGDYEIYEIQLYKDEATTLTLEVPSGADFDLSVECRYYTADPQPGHEDHYWLSWSNTEGEDEEIEFTVPHDGKYYIGVLDYSGSGPYTLTIEIPGRATLIFGMEPMMFYAIIGVLAVTVVGGAIFFLRARKPKAPPTYAPPPVAPAAPPTNFCPGCGAPLQPGVAFCPKCGRKVA